MEGNNVNIEEIHQMIAAIRGDDKIKRLHALANLHTIAQILRPDRTREELIPYVIETVTLGDIEYKKVASELGIMLKEVGGPDKVQTLTKALKFLCENEDYDVREKAVESIVSLGQNLNLTGNLDVHFADLIQDMCGDCWYPLRCAGASILCKLFKSLTPESRTKVSPLLITLSTDSIVLVRKSLAQSFHYLVQLNSCDTSIISQIIKTFASDESPAVTIELPKSLVLLAKTDLTLALASAEDLFNSKTWQPKAVLIAYMDEICIGDQGKALVKTITENAVSSPPVEIRAAIARKLNFVYTSKAFSKFEEFHRIVTTLSTDQELSVRTAVATSIGQMKTAPKDFLTSILSLHLSDEEFDVKMAALSSVASTGCALDAASKNLLDLIKFSSWRVKKGIALLIPMIAEPIDEAAFNNELFKIVISLLNDEASDVREAMVKALVPLAKHFGTDWVDSKIIPIINDLYGSNDYMLRKTAILVIISLDLIEKCCDIMDKIVVDPVPNVRMILARELPSSQTRYLDILVKDSDQDVVAYAKK